MANKTTKGCTCTINGIEITPEWLMKNRDMEFEAARQRIYKFNNGKMKARTVMSLPSEKKRKAREWKAGTWESVNIPDDGRVGSNRTGRPQGTPARKEEPAYSPGQFRINL